jgi:hypothetical protein
MLNALTGSFSADRSLLYAMLRDQMSLEEICPMEGFSRRFRTEFAYHSPLVVGQGVAILVVPSRESLLVIFTGSYWAFFRTLGLVSEHMHPEILQVLATIWQWAKSSAR